MLNNECLPLLLYLCCCQNCGLFDKCGFFNKCGCFNKCECFDKCGFGKHGGFDKCCGFGKCGFDKCSLGKYGFDKCGCFDKCIDKCSFWKSCGPFSSFDCCDCGPGCGHFRCRGCGCDLGFDCGRRFDNWCCRF